MDALFKICALVAFFGTRQCQSAESETIGVDWCDHENRMDAPHQLDYMIERPVYYAARHGERAAACYFQVKGATKEANIKESRQDREVYFFSFDVARGICRKFSATLPTIRDKREHDFVKGLSTRVLYDEIALGAELTYYGTRQDESTLWSTWRILRWDDDVPGIDVFPSELQSYPSKTDPEHDALGLIFFTNYKNTEWGFFVETKSGPGMATPVEVVCKQNLTKFSSSSKTTRRQSGKSQASTYPKMTDVSYSPNQVVYGTSNGQAKGIDVNWCDQESRADAPQELADMIEQPVYYSAGRGEGAAACYFQVKGATEKANFVKKQPGTIDYFFSFPIARGICGKFTATLPTIRDKGENAFVAGLSVTERILALGAELIWDGETLGELSIRWLNWRIQQWDDQLPGMDVPLNVNLPGIGIPANKLISARCPTDYEHDALGLILYANSTTWGVLSKSSGTPRPVAVVCKQNLTKFNSQRKTTTHGQGVSTSSQRVSVADNGNVIQPGASSPSSGSIATTSIIIKFLKLFVLAMTASEYCT